MLRPRPQQKVSYNEKVANDNEWGKHTIDYYLDSSSILGNDDSRRHIYQNYHIYNNKIPEELFHYVTNPLNSNKAQYKNFPARIRSYNIIRPNVDLFIGEYRKRPFNYQVINTSEEAYNTFLDNKKKALYGNIKQHYINEQVAQGLLDPSEHKEVQLPEDLEKEFIKSYKDIKASKGQSALKYINKTERLEEVYKRCFFDYIVSGECHTYKTIDRSSVKVDRINPLDVETDKSPDFLYGEDGNYSIRRKLVSIGDIVDLLYDEITKEELDDLENNLTTYSIPSDYHNTSSSETRDIRDKLYLYHVCWKSQRKIGILSYYDDFGQPQQIEVDEDYKADKSLGESIEWMWVNEWWEGYRIDKEYYYKIRPVPVQRGSLNNLSSSKSPYNSLYFSNENSLNTSILELGIPYQTLFIILNYKIELTIAKSKGKVVLLDGQTIPSHGDWDEEKFFYYSEALGWGLINRSQIGVDKTYNQYQVIDFSLFDQISQLINLKDSIKEDYDELIGITRQRKGNVTSSDSVGGTELATINSSIISEHVFDRFDDWKRAEYEGVLDLSKFAFIEGKKSLYLDDNLRSQLLDLDPEDFLHSEMGVVVSNSSKDIDQLKSLKAYAQAFAQNGSKPSTVAKVIKAESMVEITSILEEVESIQEKIDANLAENEREAEAARDNRLKEFEEYKHLLGVDLMEKTEDRKDNQILMQGEIDIKKESISDESPAESMSISDIEKRSLEREELYRKKDDDINKVKNKNRELDLKEKSIEIEKYKADNQLKIAKENKNKHDK